MRRVLPLLICLFAAAPAAAADDPAAFSAAFTGSWKCGSVPWTFAALEPGSPWTRVTYASGAGAGTAIVGYVEGLKAFVYRDFHADGSYADASAPAPLNGVWNFSGPYYFPGAPAPLNGRIRWVQKTRDRFDREFGTLREGALVPMGGDTCTRTGT